MNSAPTGGSTADIERRLVEATLQRHQIAAGEWLPPPSRALADRIQQQVAVRLDLHPVGWKIAATNALAQQKRGIQEPVFGRLYRERMPAPDHPVPRNRFVDPYLEIEFAFRFGSSLPFADSPLTPAAVMNAIETVAPSIEIVDSRLEHWRTCDALSLIADNVAHGGAVVGEGCRTWRSLDLAACTTRLQIDGHDVTSGTGANVLGDPLVAVTWLANRLRRNRIPIRAGDLVLSGSTGDVVRLDAGWSVSADFQDLGCLEIHFES